MKTLKRLAAIVATVALTVGMSANCFAATWHSYFGLDEGWYEGAEGKLTSNSATGWTADMASIGWGGCWGGQVDQKVTIKKGEKYTLKCTLSSSKCDKWVFIKIAKGDNFAFGKWVQVKKGKSVTVNETFTAKNDANQITFGIGGDFGDRTGIDKDAEARYAYAPGGAKSIDDKDSTYATKLTCKDYSLASAEATTKAAANTNNDNNSNDTNTTSTGTTSTSSTDTTTGTTSTVATGDFTPIACGAAAVVAAAVIVVFARKRETE